MTPLTDSESMRIAAIIRKAWDEAEHLSGMYNGDFRWAIDRLEAAALRKEVENLQTTTNQKEINANG